MDAVNFLKQKARMCDTEADNMCQNCPINLLDTSGECDSFYERNPEKAVEIVMKWAKSHPEYPTWREWLEPIYKYYRGFGSKTFEEWLDTPIQQDEATRFNIEAKEIY